MRQFINVLSVLNFHTCNYMNLLLTILLLCTTAFHADYPRLYSRNSMDLNQAAQHIDSRNKSQSPTAVKYTSATVYPWDAKKKRTFQIIEISKPGSSQSTMNVDKKQVEPVLKMHPTSGTPTSAKKPFERLGASFVPSYVTANPHCSRNSEKNCPEKAEITDAILISDSDDDFPEVPALNVTPLTLISNKIPEPSPSEVPALNVTPLALISNEISKTSPSEVRALNVAPLALISKKISKPSPSENPAIIPCVWKHFGGDIFIMLCNQNLFSCSCIRIMLIFLSHT